MEEAELLALINGGQGTASRPGEGPGRGGVSRGPGTAPITLADEASDLGTVKLEAVSNQDLSRALPADVVGISEGEHELDQSGTGPRTAGDIGSAGRGGETVWRDTLAPEEKAILKQFFE